LPQEQSNTRPIDRVLAHLEGVRRSGTGWMAKCPHHDDRQPSLSIKEADDGKVLLHCMRGCGNADIVVSAGLAFVDLFPPRSRERWQPRVWMGGVPMASHGRPALESFGDDRTAAMLGELARLASVRGRLDAQIAGAMRLVSAAVDVSPERLAEAVRAALATEEPA
jgi:CHC2 zinc finger